MHPKPGIEKANLDIIFVEKVDDSNVIFEGDLVGFWKTFKGWHVSSICLNCLENVFGKCNRVEFEIGLE